MVRQLAWSCSLALLAACASTPERSSPGGDSGASRVLDARGNERIPITRQPTQDELSSAFDAEEPPTTSSGGAQLSGTGKVPGLPADVDPLAARGQAWVTREAQVRQQVAAKDPAALGAAQSLAQEADALGPPYLVRGLKLVVDAARAAGDDAAAHAAASEWLLACGPTNPDACRREALAALARTQRGLTHPGRVKARLAELKGADGCLKATEAAARRKGGALPGCVEAALRTFRRERDGLQTTRLLVARGKHASWDESRGAAALRDLQRATSECSEPRCAAVRQQAWERLAWLHTQRSEKEAAARAALRAMEAGAQTLPWAQRRWAWTDTAQKACAAYDAEAGEGACRRLERSLLGTHTFKDYSKHSSGDGLSMETVREVNAHFAVTLTPCLAEEAARLIPPAHERYTVRWVVLNDGTVAEMHMERKEREDSPIAQCLRQKLSVWRYPRYEGEYQHVEQAFAVSASRRH